MDAFKNVPRRLANVLTIAGLLIPLATFFALVLERGLLALETYFVTFLAFIPLGLVMLVEYIICGTLSNNPVLVAIFGKKKLSANPAGVTVAEKKK